MKRVCAAGLAACLLLFPHAAAVSGPPSVSAASAILVDAESGRVLYEKDAHDCPSGGGVVHRLG